MRLRLVPPAALLAVLWACGGDSGSGERPRAPLPDAASLIPAAPAPQPTPTPAPGTASGDPTPLPAVPGRGGSGGSDGDASGCGSPSPPPVSRVGVKVHGGNGDRVLLDSTPLVGPDVEYCRTIGFTDGRSYCPVRPEGHPERIPCEAARVGRAADTGRVGPTWSAAGRRCDDSGDDTGCRNHPDNQFLVYAWGRGPFRACVASGVCGEIALESAAR